MFPYEEYISGIQIRDYMRANVDVVVYLALLYLGMIKYGPGIAARLMPTPKAAPAPEGKRPRPPADPEWLRISMIIWNFFLSSFSFWGMLVIVPALFETLKKEGLHNTVCKNQDHLFYTGIAGSWTGLFVLSKIPELIDTLFLILQKKKTPPFLHWYHHVSVLLFAWLSYSSGNSTMPVFAAMNITVHAIMYFYFAVCACGFKKIVRPFAPFITAIQILQMVGGTILTCYSYSVNFPEYIKGNNDMKKLPCGVEQATARFGALMYLSYLYLFGKLFVKSYL